MLQKRLDYGSCGHHIPAMPHFPKAAKGKRSIRRKFEDNQMCAIELLATVAGKLLTEGENSSSLADITRSSNPTVVKDFVKQEQIDEPTPIKSEFLDQDNCDESTLGPKEADLPPDSGFKKPNVFDKESIINSTRGEFGCLPVSESVEYKEDRSKSPLQSRLKSPKGEIIENCPDVYSLVDQMDLDVKPSALVSSGSIAEAPLYRNHFPSCSSSPKCRDGTKPIVDRDDDENFSGCARPSTITSKVYRPHCIGDRRVRKLLAPKFRHKGELSNTETKPAFRIKKMCYTRQRTQRTLFKRRRLFDHCSISSSGEEIFREGISNSHLKGNPKKEASASHATSHGANRASSSRTDQKPSFESADYHVKLRIKSFRVPELFIEIPETATIGSLKRNLVITLGEYTHFLLSWVLNTTGTSAIVPTDRSCSLQLKTVMEAVTAILSGGLHVGVLLQGKKVRDDNKTLRQAGLSDDDKLENLGFTLEPNSAQAPQQLTVAEDRHLLDACDVTQPLARIPPPDHGESDNTLRPILTSITNSPESDLDSDHSPTNNMSAPDKITGSSRAIVVVPPMNVEALAVVPLRKPKRSELAQRRIRRPFSVAEVEALVQAVEKLGTGRWRDVKLRAFDDAKHRTYVDLKDKWKTLVHTARISPQQRRGEPVPQELLDRVLSAHAYWTQQQAKLQPKPPVPMAESAHVDFPFLL
ncbi:telomere repeat-binding protein 2-like isoform X3 [Ananas comosus]|uniref:Telomere repeat-binding protein 2-like isoform X3 n=1 Tax=Ananas comosus TaxID=4615 RepID=A0A6P5ET20_ANACO|nr:telomere repeat-binding protein 2-like isoform X3 [Ananas comosus]